MIYFMQPPTGGPIKIGFTEDLDRRRKQLEAHYGVSLVVLATMEGSRIDEQSIHRRFARQRFGRTEQFQPSQELMEFMGHPILVDSNPDLVEAMSVQSLPIKLPVDVIEMARIVAACRNESMTDLLGDMLRPQLEKMQREEFAKRSKPPKGKGGSKE